jgi:hypothetical protein
VQGKIFDPKKEEIRGNWKTHCIMKINVSDDWTNIIKVIKSKEMDEACGTHEEKTNAYMVLSVKPEGKGVFGRSQQQGKTKNLMDFKMLGWEGVDWIRLSQDRKKRRALVNTVMT